MLHKGITPFLGCFGRNLSFCKKRHVAQGLNLQIRKIASPVTPFPSGETLQQKLLNPLLSTVNRSEHKVSRNVFPKPKSKEKKLLLAIKLLYQSGN